MNRATSRADLPQDGTALGTDVQAMAQARGRRRGAGLFPDRCLQAQILAGHRPVRLRSCRWTAATWSYSTTGVDDAPGRLSITLTAANLARSSGPKPNWIRQRNTMLVAMSWRRQTAATLTPSCSASITIASFSSSVKLRRFDRRSRGGSPGTEVVRTVSADGSLAALLTSLLICARALG